MKAAAVPRIALHDGLGKLDFTITTTSPEAQQYFSQGLAYAYGFNHAAAIASFREAQRLDPTCAMCWWGEAFAHGPNINAPMDAAANARAVGVAAYADWLARNATPAERALTGAMVKRYSLDPKAERATLDATFADAMLAAATAHPRHDDIALLAAEAAAGVQHHVALSVVGADRIATISLTDPALTVRYANADPAGREGRPVHRARLDPGAPDRRPDFSRKDS